MKKVLLICIVLLITLLAVGQALAWRGHPRVYSPFGIFIGPPVFFVPPPSVYPRYYYPPNYYNSGYRVLVPGHWDYRDTPYGWGRLWIRGHWEWR